MSHHSPSTSSGAVPAAQQRRFEVMLRRPENRVCFDCGARQPRWASTNLGIFFCLRCAGIHRSMGVHISKVKSTNMDAWEPSMIEFIEHVGNARGRVLYEHNMPDGAKVKSYTDSHTAEKLLRGKYEKKQFYNPQFESVLAMFLATPIVDDGQMADVNPSTAARGGLGTLANPPPSRAQAPPPPDVEDIWGAPVTSTVAAQTNARASQPHGGSAPNVTSSHMDALDLFASNAPAGMYTAGPAPVWGTPAGGQNMHTPYTAPPRSHTQPPSAGASSLGFLFPEDATPHSAVQPQRAHTEDLLQGGPATGTTRATESEILSLFDSAPPIGSYAGGQSGASQGNGANNRAWQPQIVRPYYKPEW